MSSIIGYITHYCSGSKTTQMPQSAVSASSLGRIINAVKGLLFGTWLTQSSGSLPVVKSSQEPVPERPATAQEILNTVTGLSTTLVNQAKDAVTSEDCTAVINTCQDLLTFVNCNFFYPRMKRQEKEKTLAAVSYVNALLQTHAELASKNSEAAQMLLNSMDFSYLELKIILLIVESSNFDPHQLSSKQAKRFLERIMRGFVIAFKGVSNEMKKNVVILASKAELNKDELAGHIEYAVIANEFDLADQLIELNEGVVPNLELKMERAIREESLDLAMWLIEKSGEEVLNRLVKTCIDTNLDHFLIKILNAKQYCMSEQQRELYSTQAHAHGNLSLMKVLNAAAWKESALSRFKEIPKDEVDSKLVQYFLNSNIEDFRVFLDLLMDNQLINRDLRSHISVFANTGGRLIARFPDRKTQQTMYEEYGKSKGYANYEQQQVQYGTERSKVVSQLIEELRRDPSKSLESVYKQLNGNKPWRTLPCITPVERRYAPFKKNAFEKIKQGKTGRFPHVSGSDERLSEAQISFPVKDGQSIKLTSFGSMSNYSQYYPELRGLLIQHTKLLDSENDPKWLEQLGISEDWQELVQMDVDMSDSGSVAEFKRKVAGFYWKGIQLMPTDRGNAQTMLELQNILYQLHGFQPPAPSRAVVLPDCIALCSTYDEFIDLYDSCWDFTAS